METQPVGAVYAVHMGPRLYVAVHGLCLRACALRIRKWVVFTGMGGGGNLFFLAECSIA